jgi:Zn-dependent protease with chaperone function
MTSLIRLCAILMMALVLPAEAQKAKKPKEIKPGMNFFSIEQDIQMGKEYAAQVEKHNPPINDPKLQAFADSMLRRLTASKYAGQFPYTIKVIYDDSINAFALPGGPMYLHTGLIKAADNEAQIAGVLAHEISHVALRHGTNQASKSQIFQLPALLAGAAGGGLIGSLAQAGIGLGANSVLMKFSRGAESDADINGTRMMADVGYDPVQMAKFFEKLEAEAGNQSGLSAFFSSHPNPGDRVKRVEEELSFIPRKDFDLGDQRRFDEIKAYVKGLKAPVKPAAPAAGAGPSGSLSLPQQPPAAGRKTFRGAGFEMSHPENWVSGMDQKSGSGIIGPRESIEPNSGAVALGVLTGTFKPQRARDLASATEELVNGIVQSNQGMRVMNKAQQIQVSGRDAYMVMLQGQSPLGGAERDVVVAMNANNVLQYFVFVAPEASFSQYESLFQEMLRSVRF